MDPEDYMEDMSTVDDGGVFDPEDLFGDEGVLDGPWPVTEDGDYSPQIDYEHDGATPPVQSAPVVVGSAPTDGGGGLLDGLVTGSPLVLGGGAAVAAYWLAPAKYRFTAAIVAGLAGYFGPQLLSRMRG